jgi:hypothetical protein
MIIILMLFIVCIGGLHMPLTDPGTRSPGRLVISYQVGTIEHLSGAWIIASLDLDASLSDLRGDASSMASAIMDSCPNTADAHTWSLVDPAGVTLFSENFADLIPGTRTPAEGSFTAQSAMITVTGKGTPPTITTALGVTRTSVFLGFFTPSFMLNKDYLAVGDGIGWDLLIFLRESDRVGCDRFGQKATYSSRVLLDINSHYEKNYGI